MPDVATTQETTDAELVTRASSGDQAAWGQLVGKYTRVVMAVTRTYRLSPSDGADVTQTCFLRLLEHIDRIDPARVGGWLVVTTRRECLRVLAMRKRMVLAYDEASMAELPADLPEPDARLLADERAGDVRRALRTLPERWQAMLGMLMTDPPRSYEEISQSLKIPIGSIGPIRGRCLAKLRVLLEAA